MDDATIKSLTIDGFPGGPRTIHFPTAGNLESHVRSILSGKEYRLPKLTGYQPDLIIDIGANIGATTLYFAAVFPNIPITCFEPSSDNLRWLERNTADLPHIGHLPIGLGPRNDTLKLYRGQSQCMQHSLYQSVETGTEFEEVEIKKASEALACLADASGALIKIDCEGGEPEILNDIKAFFNNIDLIMVEYHSDHDRLAIDRLLEADFVLYAARANWPHRGQNHYASRRLCRRYPNLDILRIQTGDLS